MHPFIKENLSFIAALALPVIFAIFFLISKQLTVNTAPPPAYDFILAQTVNYNGNFEIGVIDEKFSLKFIYPKADNGIPNITAPELYYVNAASMVAEPLGIDLPSDARNPARGKEATAVKIPVRKLENLRLSAVKISPDGYELDNEYYYRNGNLMTEIFSSGSRRYDDRLSLRKDGARQAIKGIGHNASLEIVGWVIPQTAEAESAGN